MQLARDDVLADAAFTTNEYVHVAVGDAFDHVHHRAHRHRWTPAQLRALGVFRHLGAESRDFGAQRFAFERVTDRGFEGHFPEAFRIARFEHIVRCAEAHGLDDGRGRLAAGQHDHLRGGMRAANRPQRFQTIQVRHGYVEQDHVRSETATQCLEKLAAAMKDVHGIATRLQQRLQEVGKGGIIIDDCETGRSWSRSLLG
jgi:hypothetical protein